MDVADFLGIGVIGIGLSLVIEAIKSMYGPASDTTKLITVGLAIVVGTAYYFLRQTIWWQTILGILATASTVYAFLLK